jgi:hypothetical protein
MYQNFSNYPVPLGEVPKPKNIWQVIGIMPSKYDYSEQQRKFSGIRLCRWCMYISSMRERPIFVLTLFSPCMVPVRMASLNIYSSGEVNFLWTHIIFACMVWSQPILCCVFCYSVSNMLLHCYHLSVGEVNFCTIKSWAQPLAAPHSNIHHAMCVQL